MQKIGEDDDGDDDDNDGDDDDDDHDDWSMCIFGSIQLLQRYYIFFSSIIVLIPSSLK